MKNFTLLNTSIINSGVWARVSLSAKNIYIILRRHSDPNYKPVWCGVQRIGAMCGLSKNTVKNGLDELIHYGLISRKSRGLKYIFYFTLWDGVSMKRNKIIHNNFISIENDLIDSGAWAKLSNSVKQVYLMLKWKSKIGSGFQLSQSKIAKLIGVSLKTVERAIKKLVDLGIIVKKLMNGCKTVYSLMVNLGTILTGNPRQNRPEPPSKLTRTPVNFDPKQEITKNEQEEDGVTHQFKQKEKNTIMLDILDRAGLLKTKNTETTADILRREIISALRILQRLGVSDPEITDRIMRIKTVDQAVDLQKVLILPEVTKGPYFELIKQFLDEMRIN